MVVLDMREEGTRERGGGQQEVLTMAQVPMVAMLLDPAKGAWVL
jgi:hypothetical protein